MPLVNHAFAGGTPVSFVIFVVSRCLSSKALVLQVRPQIRHFRRFRQKPNLFGGTKARFTKKRRFLDPEILKKNAPRIWADILASDQFRESLESCSENRASHKLGRESHSESCSENAPEFRELPFQSDPRSLKNASYVVLKCFFLLCLARKEQQVLSVLSNSQEGTAQDIAKVVLELMWN